MNRLIVILLLLLTALQFRLWVGDGSLSEIAQLQAEIDARERASGALRERNATLQAEVLDLRSGSAAIEERARSELGMIRRGETFYQVVGNAEPEPWR